MTLSDEDRDRLALRLVPGIGPHLYRALLDRFGSVAKIRAASLPALCEVPYLGEKVARQLQASLQSRDVDEELRLMQEHGVALLRAGTADYPAALAQVAVPPEFLFIRGALSPRDQNAVAIVGSRHCTAYGRRVAEQLAFGLARAGVTVVSGLARGIDGAAHQAALQAGGRTLAVLAGGLRKIYPPEHADLADAVARHGALITESPMRMEPMRELFPARNRIISGLCRAVVLVEAAEQSGALITARHAAEQGREVFAVPGPVDSAASAGTLALLRKGAKLVRHAQDILEDLGGVAPLFDAIPGQAPLGHAKREKPADMNSDHERIWTFLEERRNIDELCRFTEKPIAELSVLLMTMEMRKLIRRLPGNEYERY